MSFLPSPQGGRGRRRRRGSPRRPRPAAAAAFSPAAARRKQSGGQPRRGGHDECEVSEGPFTHNSAMPLHLIIPILPPALIHIWLINHGHFYHDHVIQLVRSAEILPSKSSLPFDMLCHLNQARCRCLCVIRPCLQKSVYTFPRLRE